MSLPRSGCIVTAPARHARFAQSLRTEDRRREEAARARRWRRIPWNAISRTSAPCAARARTRPSSRSTRARSPPHGDRPPALPPRPRRHPPREPRRRTAGRRALHRLFVEIVVDIVVFGLARARFDSIRSSTMITTRISTTIPRSPHRCRDRCRHRCLWPRSRPLRLHPLFDKDDDKDFDNDSALPPSVRRKPGRCARPLC